MPPSKESGRIRIRTKLFFISSLLLFSLIILRLIYLQIINFPYFYEKAKIQRIRTMSIEGKRGIIYDRLGEELTLNLVFNSLYANPREIKDKKGTAKKLARLLGMDYKNIYTKISKETHLGKDRYFVWIKRKLKDEEAKVLKEAKIKGVGFVPESKRFYPRGNFASHVIGFTGIDCQGLQGLEVFYEDYLKPVSGEVKAERDVKGLVIPDGYYKAKPPQNGSNLILTIDGNIQHIVEREIDKLNKKFKPKRAVIIVMDACTGEILGMANRPSFDPNNFLKTPKSYWRNSAISWVYEPGSTFKVFMAMAALEAKAVTPSETFYCRGYLPVGNHIIRDGHNESYGSLNLTGIIRESSNVGAAQVGLRLGKEKFYNYIKKFGFGEKSGIDLPGEERGLILPFKKWSSLTVSNVAFGQGIGVTPIQLITAFSAIPNGGWLMKPYLVQKIEDAKGEIVIHRQPQIIRRIISENNAYLLSNMLEEVVKAGTGKSAGIEGYKICGKTGTAQKVVPGIGYSTDKFVSSFIGYVSTPKKKISILVVADEPQGAYYGGVVAAPFFRSVAKDILCYLGIPPKKTEEAVVKSEDGKKIVAHLPTD